MKCVVILFAAALLAACSERGSNYCAAEGRRLSDAELKGRILLNIRNSKDENAHLRKHMIEYLAKRLPPNASDDQVRAALTDYVVQYPLCCQILDNLDDWKGYDNRDYEPYQPGSEEIFGVFYLQYQSIDGLLPDRVIVESHKSLEKRDPANYSKLVQPVSALGGVTGCGRYFDARGG